MPRAKDTLVNKTNVAPLEAYREAQTYFMYLSVWFITSVDWAIELDKFDDIDCIFGEKNLYCLFGRLSIKHKKKEVL